MYYICACTCMHTCAMSYNVLPVNVGVGVVHNEYVRGVWLMTVRLHVHTTLICDVMTGQAYTGKDVH